MAEIELLPEAIHDASAAYHWYEGRATGLGDEFMRCLEDCLLSIRRMPLGFQKVKGKYRRALVRRFPYAVFYAASKKKVVVYSVFHCSQNPSKWRERLT